MAETLTVTVDDGGTYTIDVRGVSLFTDSGLTTPATFPVAVSAQTTWYAAAPSKHGPRANIEVLVTASDGSRVPVPTFNSLPATVSASEGGAPDFSGPATAASGVPVGGTTGQVLKKNSNTDGDAGWGNTAQLSNNNPLALASAAAPGTGTDASRSDHVHPVAAPTSAAPAGQYGDGSDGNVTISVNTTMSRDMYYANLTVNTGVTLNTNGWRLYVSGILTNNGTIGCPGLVGTAGTNNFGNGAAGNQNALGGGKAGGNGGTPGNGAAGSNGNNALAATAAGGAGGAGATGTAGGGGTANQVGATSLTPRSPLSAFTGIVWNFSGPSVVGGGAGGGGGGGDGTNNGGGGGGGGGVTLVNGNVLINNGSINADGGAGRAPATGNCGGGGGGAGGSVLVNTTSLTGGGTVTANGGAGGLKAGTGSNGSAGGAGFVQTVVWTA